MNNSPQISTALRLLSPFIDSRSARTVKEAMFNAIKHLKGSRLGVSISRFQQCLLSQRIPSAIYFSHLLHPMPIRTSQESAN
jgi:hypothetical protein